MQFGFAWFGLVSPLVDEGDWDREAEEVWKAKGCDNRTRKAARIQSVGRSERIGLSLRRILVLWGPPELFF